MSAEVEALWERAAALRRASEAAGVVIPLPHRTQTLTTDGIEWVVRVLTGAAPDAPTEPDPFLPPYDPRLHVADLGRQHALLLNKYPVLDGHLLIVTQSWAPQAAFPEPADFAATAPLLGGRPALAFYNSGPASGASQPHRHFQAVTLPLGPVPAAIPTAAWIERAAAGAPLPFAGAAAELPAEIWSGSGPGEKLHATASELLRCSGRDPAAPGSFNLLFTRDWMLAVPRTRRRFGGVSVNSLGYAGALIAKSGEGLDTLSKRGPLAVLAGAASNTNA